MPLFAITIFLSALLLFLIQPLAARWLLPYYGGGAAVWTACMLFFQLMLLAGYSYAHWLTHRLSLKQQRTVHGSLVLLALLWLWWAGSVVSAPEPSGYPLLSILSWLLLLFGLPLLVIAASAPLVQRWFADRFPLRSPYRLYALSNVGSLGALLSYPFIVEPWLPLSQQFTGWQWGFTGLALLLLALLRWQLPKASTTSEAVAAASSRQWGYWLSLSAAGVVLLLAVTQQLTQNVPPVPFLWVVPLALYLLSFILVFNREHWYQRAIWLYLFGIGLVLALVLIHFGRLFDLYSQLALYLLILFSGCMLCHGELARLKPAASQLTRFYLAMALGGVLGGLLVNLLAPLLLNDFHEFPLVLLAILLLAVLPWQRQLVLWRKVAWLSGAASFALLAIWLHLLLNQFTVHQERNFYGSLVVRDIPVAGELQRILIDGTTSHGAQYLVEDQRQQALSYYRPGTGVALALQYGQPEAGLANGSKSAGRHFGMVGLGAGTLAVYGKAGDRIQFYELNPAVISTAQQHFSYLADSAATIEVLQGDGRLVLQQQLQQQGSQQFDVLVLDAFSSDAIPQHLLTREAFALYLQHLRADGVLAVHISNNYLDLTSVVRNHAHHFGLDALFFHTPADSQNPAATEWVLLTTNQDFIRQEAIQQAAGNWPTRLNPAIQWTDDFSNLLRVLK
ncbi:fused MFS/spermidine synthase [Alkalimonas delamerensis]|uniref:Fused MFS/spermidine synthase n=1 Tax=Alkalimonas delamerensis TaxID=265981 RepID=A0ABT9GM21_9GAMM|nr:fused MFS/spermidine synthase [Alkalimonas delamerensis]MDP4527979.1 fused MFS/spermidine synthase [Alkalimonas delamerensis]